MTRDDEPRLRKAALSRRLLLAAGGLVLLGECVASEGSGVAARQGQPYPMAIPGIPAGANARPMPTRHPSGPGGPARSRHDPSSPAREPVPGPRHPGNPNGEPMLTVDDGPNVIALTIDDGPSRVYTPQVLSLLSSYGITATFSMVGRNVAANPAVARDVAAAGHLIANHTWSHASLPALAPIAVADQINRAGDTIHQVTGRQPTLFRAPYGSWSEEVLAQCRHLGLTPLDWSVDPRDWARPGVSAITGNILRNTRSGSIILEHDGGGNRSQTVAALTYVLPRLLAKGFRFGIP